MKLKPTKSSEVELARRRFYYARDKAARYSNLIQHEPLSDPVWNELDALNVNAEEARQEWQLARRTRR